nr:trans-3-hydroxy-l-proline dehydratase [Quercus suber]
MTTPPRWQECEDWHTGGEPFRIVKQLPPGCLSSSSNVSETRLAILRTPNHPLDLLRRTLCHEPRGHADMYGGFIVPPNDSGAHFGVLFWHKDGFSTACGHGTIALGYWALAHELVAWDRDTVQVDVVIDVPSGRVVARAHCNKGVVKHVDFINVMSYQLVEEIPLKIPRGGEQLLLHVNLSFAGAVYASVEANALGIDVCPSNHQDFINIQRQIRQQLSDFKHQDIYDLYGVCFFEDEKNVEGHISQKNVVVFADGQIDRSPCGSGTCARVAALLAQGKMDGGKTLLHTSIIGTRFEAMVDERVASPTRYPACIPRVRGQAHLVGRHDFYIDHQDPVFPGFLLR